MKNQKDRLAINSVVIRIPKSNGNKGIKVKIICNGYDYNLILPFGLKRSQLMARALDQIRRLLETQDIDS